MSRIGFTVFKPFFVLLAALFSLIFWLSAAVAQTSISDWRIEYHRTGSITTVYKFGYWWLDNYIYNEYPSHEEWTDKVENGPFTNYTGRMGNYSFGLPLTNSNCSLDCNIQDSFVVKLIWNKPNSSPPPTIWVEEEGFASWQAGQHSKFPECFVNVSGIVSITDGVESSSISTWGSIDCPMYSKQSTRYKLQQLDSSSGEITLPPVSASVAFNGNASLGNSVGHDYPWVDALCCALIRVTVSDNEPGKVNITGVSEGQVVSGTDAPGIAFTAAGSSDAQTVTSMTCKIGGEVVAKYPNTNDPRFANEAASLSFVKRRIEAWATTHFTNETSVPIYVQATFSDGSTRDKTVNVKVVNKAYI